MVNKMEFGSSMKRYKMAKIFILENITSPVFRDGKEINPPGYIIFPSLWHYKKIKNLNRIIRYFYLNIHEEISNNEVFKCLDLIESFIEKCGKVKLFTEDTRTFAVVFPGIVTFIKIVGFRYGHGEKKDIYDVGINLRFENDDNKISENVIQKYCNIIYKLYDQNIWPFGYFEFENRNGYYYY